MRHQPDDGGGIHAAGEKGAERHIADQVRPNGSGEHVPQGVRRLGFASAERLRGGDLPVAPDVDASLLPAQVVPGRHLSDAFED